MEPMEAIKELAEIVQRLIDLCMVDPVYRHPLSNRAAMLLKRIGNVQRSGVPADERAKILAAIAGSGLFTYGEKFSGPELERRCGGRPELDALVDAVVAFMAWAKGTP